MRQRMYHLVVYNMSPIQQAIQAYHSGVEYGMKYFRTPQFQRWAKEDKTVIIYNGGTSNSSLETPGSLQLHIWELEIRDIPFASFIEPDINNAVTALAFLVDERVWDRETYPPLFDIVSGKPFKDELTREGSVNENGPEFLGLKNLYGDQVAFLRIWLRQFKFA